MIQPLNRPYGSNRQTRDTIFLLIPSHVAREAKDWMAAHTLKS